jgi:hypothetical protein
MECNLEIRIADLSLGANVEVPLNNMSVRLYAKPFGLQCSNGLYEYHHTFFLLLAKGKTRIMPSDKVNFARLNQKDISITMLDETLIADRYDPDYLLLKISRVY